MRTSHLKTSQYLLPHGQITFGLFPIALLKTEETPRRKLLVHLLFIFQKTLQRSEIPSSMFNAFYGVFQLHPAIIVLSADHAQIFFRMAV
jgi:hypothetical protein